MRNAVRPAFLSILLISAAGPSPALADQTQPALLTGIRVYDAGPGSVVFIETATNVACTTSVFKFNLPSAAGQGMLSASITALLARRSIKLEISAAGCNGWGTLLKSVELTTSPVASSAVTSVAAKSAARTSLSQETNGEAVPNSILRPFVP